MREVQHVPWLRTITEGVAIVASILLAFAIDAWWQRRAELEQADALVVSLYADFQASQAHLERWLVGNRRIHSATTELLDQITSAERGEEISVPIELIVGAIGAPTYSPTDSTLDAAVSSGQIELIEDSEIRSILALWRQQLADTSEDEILIREIVVHQLVPELSEQVRLAEAFDFKRLTDWFFDHSDANQDEPIQLRATTKLEGALAERVFYTTFVVGGLTEIYETQAEILRLLGEHPSGE
jgi:hypothetical protein